MDGSVWAANLKTGINLLQTRQSREAAGSLRKLPTIDTRRTAVDHHKQGSGRETRGAYVARAAPSATSGALRLSRDYGRSGRPQKQAQGPRAPADPIGSVAYRAFLARCRQPRGLPVRHRGFWGRQVRKPLLRVQYICFRHRSQQVLGILGGFHMLAVAGPRLGSGACTRQRDIQWGHQYL